MSERLDRPGAALARRSLARNCERRGREGDGGREGEKEGKRERREGGKEKEIGVGEREKPCLYSQVVCMITLYVSRYFFALLSS